MWNTQLCFSALVILKSSENGTGFEITKLKMDSFLYYSNHHTVDGEFFCLAVACLFLFAFLYTECPIK